MKFEKTITPRISDKERMAFNTTLFAFDDLFDFMVMNDFSTVEIGDSKVSLDEIEHIMEMLECLNAEEIKIFK